MLPSPSAPSCICRSGLFNSAGLEDSRATAYQNLIVHWLIHVTDWPVSLLTWCTLKIRRAEYVLLSYNIWSKCTSRADYLTSHSCFIMTSLPVFYFLSPKGRDSVLPGNVTYCVPGGGANGSPAGEGHVSPL